MTRLFFAAVAVLALSGCGERQAAADAKQMNGQQLASERDRCRDLGLKAYDDPACKAAQQERQDRFLGKTKGPGS